MLQSIGIVEYKNNLGYLKSIEYCRLAMRFSHPDEIYISSSSAAKQFNSSYPAPEKCGERQG